MEGKFIRNEILIQASPERIWQVLTQPEETRKYMFGCRVQSDWKVGSKVDWIMPIEGKDTAVVVGFVLENSLPKSISYSVFDPFCGYEDLRENYLDVVYSIEAVEGGQLLKVSQGDYSKVVNGEARYADSDGDGEGWMPILRQIKTVAEEG